VRFDALGAERHDADALERHVARVLALDVLSPGRIRERALHVVVDGCASVGGVALPRLLEALGARVTELDCVPDGAFTRELEPLAEHLGALAHAVTAAGADLGVALDPDADRAAFVDAAGVPLGEEYTVALGTRVVLARHRGPVVTNLSTSRIMDDVCAKAGVTLTRTPVGEAHVVGAMRALAAVAGGEGNGGMILPACHYGRDGLVAMALVAEAMASSGRTLRELADELPRYRMIKDKTGRKPESWERAEARLRRALPGFETDDRDGLRFADAVAWVHVRPSGTEPVVRVIAESDSDAGTRELIERARAALAG
jgi:phosphomannomutase